VPEDAATGPLAGVRVVELAGIGPGPFCVMLLADMGASVVRVDRVGPASSDYTVNPVIERGRRSVAVDLKAPDGVQVVLDLVRDADVLLESYRPGVAERLGIGPSACHEANERLVYARLSGFGQDGPWAGVAGHDINYIGLTGALWSIGRAGERPVPPINLVGDLGGGAASMAFGIVCALLETQSSGRGQVVDANVLDATTTIMGFVQGLRAQGVWGLDRGTNLLDTGAPYYDTYTCADGRWVAMGTVEERFFLTALDVLGFAADDPLRGAHKDRSRWSALREALTAAFAAHTRDEWAAAFREHDACVTPILDLDEATRHEQATARGAYQPIPGFDVPQPVVSPRFSRSRTPVPPPPPKVGADTDAVLSELGYAPERVASLREAGVLR
jgi:alpha-methylacyl-CoA racemase